MKSITELTRECEAMSLDALIKRRLELVTTIQFLGKRKRFKSKSEELKEELEFVVKPLITQKTPRRASP